MRELCVSLGKGESAVVGRQFIAGGPGAAGKRASSSYVRSPARGSLFLFPPFSSNYKVLQAMSDAHRGRARVERTPSTHHPGPGLVLFHLEARVLSRPTRDHRGASPRHRATSPVNIAACAVEYPRSISGADLENQR